MIQCLTMQVTYNTVCIIVCCTRCSLNSKRYTDASRTSCRQIKYDTRTSLVNINMRLNLEKFEYIINCFHYLDL